VVVLWIVALIGVSFLSVAAGADSRDNFALPGTSSQRAYELLGERFPKDAGDSAQVVMRTDGQARARGAHRFAGDARARHRRRRPLR
jgi:RND superfamily putative drug exporter